MPLPNVFASFVCLLLSVVRSVEFTWSIPVCDSASVSSGFALGDESISSRFWQLFKMLIGVFWSVQLTSTLL